MFQAGATCYPSVEAAALASASSQIGQIWGDKIVTSVDYESRSGKPYLSYGLTDGNWQTSYLSVPVVFPACQLPNHVDSAQLSGLVLAVWAVAWGIKAVSRVITGYQGE